MKTSLLLANGSDSKTEAVFRDVQLFRTGMKLTFGDAIKDVKWPLHIVICKDEKTFNDLIPEQMQKSSVGAGILPKREKL